MAIPSSLVPDDDRHRHLDRLGVPIGILDDTLRVGYVHKAQSTEAEPPGSGSFYVYSKGTGHFREQMASHGWERRSVKNLALTVRGDNAVAIMLSSGDPATGRRDAVPRTRNPKGLAMAEVIESNQLPLFGEPAASAQPASSFATWLYMHFFDISEREIRRELSLPDAMEGGQITSWRSRIILPSLPFSMSVSNDDPDFPDDDPDVNVDVQPRSR